MTLILTTSLDTSSISQASSPSIVMQLRAATTKQGHGVQSRIGTILCSFLALFYLYGKFSGDYDIVSIDKWYQTARTEGSKKTKHEFFIVESKS